MRGKKYFYWLGTVHFEAGTEMLYFNQNGRSWPHWAQREYMRAIT